jgi:hypothetical protein
VSWISQAIADVNAPEGTETREGMGKKLSTIL